MELHKKLSERRKQMGLSIDELVIKSNVPKGTLAKLLSGNTKSPEFETVRQVAHALSLTLDDLDDGGTSFSLEEKDIMKAYRRLDSHGKQAVRAVLNIEIDRVRLEAARPIPTIKLLHFEHPTAAGDPLDADSDSEYVSRPADKVPDGADFTVKLSGHSMEPDYPDQSIVFIHRTTDISDGDVVIAWLDGKGMTCKRAVMRGNQIERLESINREEVNFEGEELRNMRIYGKVIG